LAKDEDRWLGSAPDDPRDKKQKLDSWWWRNKGKIWKIVLVVAAFSSIISLILYSS